MTVVPLIYRAVRVDRLPYDRALRLVALDLIDRAEAQTALGQRTLRRLLRHAGQARHIGRFLLLAEADIDRQRLAARKLRAGLRVGADDLALLDVVAVFLFFLELDAVRVKRRRPRNRGIFPVKSTTL